MESNQYQPEKLPKSTGILVLGILSIVFSLCCGGFIGIILAIIALVMAGPATTMYNAAPERYTGYSNVKTGKVLAIIGLIISIIVILFTVYIFSTVGYEGILEMQEEMMRDLEGI